MFLIRAMSFVTVPNLELKVPPVLLALFFAFLMWLVAQLMPRLLIDDPIRLSAILLLLAGGAFFSLAAVLSFRSAGTTVNPLTPGESTSLVTTGVYRYSRNPMYVGILLMLLAWGVFLSNLFSMVTCAGFFLYMNRYQIQPEEESLSASYGDVYADYLKKVRRWI